MTRRSSDAAFKRIVTGIIPLGYDELRVVEVAMDCVVSVPEDDVRSALYSELSYRMPWMLDRILANGGAL